MKPSFDPLLRSRRNGYVFAMLLGTALTAMCTTPGASAELSESTLQSINDMSRYCTACWRNAHLPPDCWQDCTQDVFRRLMERLPISAWTSVLKAEGEEHKEFVRAIDTVKKRMQRRRPCATLSYESVMDRNVSRQRELDLEREAVRHAAKAVLSGRQHNIVELSFEGWSVHDIANQLNLPAERVSDEKYKAIRKLRQRLCPSWAMA